MNIRESLEEREIAILSPFASHSRDSRGRDRREEECDIRTVYQRDRDRILHSKSFRRLKDKTQVFLAPQGDHYRNRLTHTLEVSQTARTIAKALCLNEDLVEAIALGHDLGHTPFGHAGEHALDQVSQEGFAHNERVSGEEIPVWDVFFTMSQTHGYILGQAGAPPEKVYIPGTIADPYGQDLAAYRACRDRLREELEVFWDKLVAYMGRQPFLP